MTERISIPATTATTHQLVHRILERVNDMVERLDRLNTAVEQELADDEPEPIDADAPPSPPTA